MPACSICHTDNPLLPVIEYEARWVCVLCHAEIVVPGSD